MRKAVQGLAGWFSKLVGTVASAIGAAIGGPIGAAVGKAAAWAVDRYVFGHKSAELTLFGFTIVGPARIGMGYLTVKPRPESDDEGSMMDNMTPDKRREIEYWLTKIIKPWITNVSGKINGNASLSELKSAAFRNEVNEVLKTLYYAEMYYRVHNSQGLSGAIFDLEDIEVDKKNKSTVLLSYITGIKEAMIQYWKSKGVEPKVVKVILSNEYHPISIPETMVFMNKTTTTIEVFVDPEMEVGGKPTSVADDEIKLKNDGTLTTRPVELSEKQFFPGVSHLGEKPKPKPSTEPKPKPEGNPVNEDVQPSRPSKEEKPQRPVFPTMDLTDRTENKQPSTQNRPSQQEKQVFPKWLWPSVGAATVTVLLSKLLK